MKWALYYSKDYDSPPISEFEFETEPLCNDRRIVDNPEKELLNISNNDEQYESMNEFDKDCFNESFKA